MKWLVGAVFVVLVLAGTFLIWQGKSNKSIVEPAIKELIQGQKPLEKYTIENLSKALFVPSEITLGEMLEDAEDFTSYKFYFYFESKKVSGLLNVPKGDGIYPVVVMFRGYVDREIYQTGVGTQRAGEVFAQNGFITISPDFLGYGESDAPSEDVFEERFQNYVVALTLVDSVGNLNETFLKGGIGARVDSNKVGIWGHSNGGQIAISALVISGKEYPSVVWAPVTKHFPYSILYYTDEFDDRGKALRRELAKFEADYDVELYNPFNYLDRIKAPISLHQGTFDDAVLLEWSDEFAALLEKLDKDVEYFVYAGADHNLVPGWDLAVSQSVEFYKEKMNVI